MVNRKSVGGMEEGETDPRPREVLDHSVDHDDDVITYEWQVDTGALVAKTEV